MSRSRAIASATGALALVTATTLGCAGSAAAAPAPGVKAYQVRLNPLNDSGATGTVLLTVSGHDLTVRISASGLVPNAPHAEHIHGSTDLTKDFHCPDASADANGDGIVSTGEGFPVYGDIFISLTTSGDTSPASGLAIDRFPVADATGHLDYQRTIPVDDATIAALPDLHVVQHGIDVNHNGSYDAGAGASELDPKLPQEATAPADCGMVEGSNIAAVPAGGVQTGGGDTTGVRSGEVVAGTAAVAAGAAGAGSLVLLRRRAARTSPPA